MPVRVAFVGKGGVGKSVIAGTFARLLARQQPNVLAVDSDPMPGLGFSLGLPGVEAPLPDAALAEIDNEGDGPRLRLSPVDAAEMYAARAPGGVRFLQFGKLRGHVAELGRSQQIFRLILRGLEDTDWHVIGDLPGGTRQPFFGWAGFARTVVVVAEPTGASLLTARRLANLARSDRAPASLVAVANKVRDPDDIERVTRATGLDVVAAVPLDRAIQRADRLGRAPIDVDPDGPAVAAVATLVEHLLLASRIY